MSDDLSAIVPAVAALAGVLLAEVWNTRRERAHRDSDLDQLLWSERKGSLLRFLVSLNKALDSTRSIVNSDAQKIAMKRLDDEREDRWAEAFERYLEASLVFPENATSLVWKQLQDAYRWRRQSIAEGRELEAPRHEDLIEQLRPWLSL